MKNILLIFALATFLFPLSAFSQVNNETNVIVVEEVMPEFQGGAMALATFLDKNVKYPKKAREEKIEGVVIVSFYIETDGSVKNIEVLRGGHPLLDEEAVRVVSSMPNWKPVIQRGEPIRVQLNLPIRFKL